MFEKTNVGDTVAIIEGIGGTPERIAKVISISRVSVFTEGIDGKPVRWLRKNGSLHGKSINHYPALSTISDAPKDIREAKWRLNKIKRENRIEVAASYIVYEHEYWTNRTQRKFVKPLEKLAAEIEAFEEKQMAEERKSKKGKLKLAKAKSSKSPK